MFFGISKAKEFFERLYSWFPSCQHLDSPLSSNHISHLFHIYCLYALLLSSPVTTHVMLLSLQRQHWPSMHKSHFSSSPSILSIVSSIYWTCLSTFYCRGAAKNLTCFVMPIARKISIPTGTFLILAYFHAPYAWKAVRTCYSQFKIWLTMVEAPNTWPFQKATQTISYAPSQMHPYWICIDISYIITPRTLLIVSLGVYQIDRLHKPAPIWPCFQIANLFSPLVISS